MFLDSMHHGCCMEMDGVGGGGGEAASLEDVADNAPEGVQESQEAPAPNSQSQNDQEVQREDFAKIAPFLRKFGQANQNAEPAEEESADNSPQEPADEEAQEKTEQDSQEKTEPDSQEKTEPEGEPPASIKLPDGREVPLNQIAEWEKGHMMQKDYTQKTQALAEERRKLQEQYGPYAEQRENYDKAMSLWRAMSRDPIGVINKLTEHYAEQGIYEEKNQEQLQLEDEKQAVQMEKQRIETEKYKMAVQEAHNMLEVKFKKLAEEHKDFNQEELARYMLDNKLTDPDMAFEAMSGPKIRESLQTQINELQEKMKNIGKEAVNDYIKNKTAKTETKPPVGSSSGGTPPVKITPAKTWQEARKAALARLGGR